MEFFVSHVGEYGGMEPNSNEDQFQLPLEYKVEVPTETVATMLEQPSSFSSSSSAPASATSVYVGNLTWKTSWQDLKDHFRQCGEIVRADVAFGQDGRSKGFGLVVFAKSSDA